MRRKPLLLAGAVVAALVGLWAGVDALVVTERERLERFVEDVSGTVTPAKIDRALSWTDATEQPVEVEVRGRARVYRDDTTLQQQAHRQLSRYQGQGLRILRQTIDVDGDAGRVELRLLTDRGMLDVAYRLRRRGERWRVEQVRVR